ncbi:MAG: hypothetical protein ACQSGP_08860, partial [Frankia sp.]
AWSLLCIDRALLQCGGLYRALAANVCMEGLSRTVVTLGTVLVGFDQSGVALGQIAAVICCVAHARWVIAQNKVAVLGGDPTTTDPEVDVSVGLSNPPVGLSNPPVVDVLSGAAAAPSYTPALPSRRLAAEVGAALVALAFLGLLQNIDVLVLGRLKPGESGAYAAISVASKVLVFGAMVLAGFLLPEAANRRHLGQHALHQLGGTLAILALPAGFLLAAAAIAPHALLSVAFGPRLTGASGALLPLAAAMTCLGATVLFTHYLLAVGSRPVLPVLAVAAAVSIPMLVAAGGHAVPTARADLLIQALLAAVTGLMVLAAARRTAARP